MENEPPKSNVNRIAIPFGSCILTSSNSFNSNTAAIGGPLIDTHAHLDDRRLADDLIGVLDRARESGVVAVVAVGVSHESSVRTVELSDQNAMIFAAIGIHPNHIAEAEPGDWDRVVELARERRPKTVAIGETGLDRYWKNTPFDDQVAAFDRHLDLAGELDLPVIIHCRDCMKDIVDRLSTRTKPIRGILHSFTGNWDEAGTLLDFGLHISFAGQATFANKNLDSLRDAAMRVPLDRLLVETDSPYLSPHPFRGRSNEPARVAVTAARIAELRGMKPVDFCHATTSNARELFRLDSFMKF